MTIFLRYESTCNELRVNIEKNFFLTKQRILFVYARGKLFQDIK